MWYDDYPILWTIYCLFTGALMAWMFIWCQTHEPFCFYIPGGVGKRYIVHKNVATRYDDLIGCDETKDEIKIFLQTDSLSRGRGMMFLGPPGNGKTMMARAIAGECNIPFIEIFCDDHTTISRLPTILDHIMKYYPKCVLFLDECETILKQSTGPLLRKIDGLSSDTNIIFICCTNNNSEIFQ